MSLALLLGLVLPMAAGWLVVRASLPREASALARIGSAALAGLCGLGLSSLLPLLWLLAGGRLGGIYVWIDAVSFASLAAILGLRAWRRETGGGARPAARSVGDGALRSGLDLIAPPIFFFALFLAAVACALLAVRLPHGEWDAWAVWNQRARFLFRAGSGWRDAFSDDLSWSQTGYPLLLPLSVARLWTYSGETTLAPSVVAAMFTLAAPAALAGAVAGTTRPLAGAVAGLLLLGTPGFLIWGAAQYADVPVAALFAGGLAAWVWAERSGDRRRSAALALGGLLLGLAAWTKNEGLVAAAAAIAARTALTARGRGARAALRDLCPIVAGLALPAAAWVAFHLGVVPDVMPRLPPWVPRTPLRQRALDPDRWLAVLSATVRAMPGAALGIPLLAPLLAALLGARARGVLRSPAVLAAVLVYGVHLAMFATTPWPLAWHLETAAERLLLQPWPALLLGLFSATASVLPALPTQGGGQLGRAAVDGAEQHAAGEGE